MQQFYKHPSASRNFCVDFTRQLATTAQTPEVLSSGASVSVNDGDGSLTIASVAINAAIVTPPNNEQTVPIGQGVTFQCSAGTAGQDYSITVSATTNSGNTLSMDSVVKVRSGY